MTWLEQDPRLRRLCGRLNLYYFLLRGRRPWGRGYSEYKKQPIIQALSPGRFSCELVRWGIDAWARA